LKKENARLHSHAVGSNNLRASFESELKEVKERLEEYERNRVDGREVKALHNELTICRDELRSVKVELVTTKAALNTSEQKVRQLRATVKRLRGMDDGDDSVVMGD